MTVQNRKILVKVPVGMHSEDASYADIRSRRVFEAAKYNSLLNFSAAQRLRDLPIAVTFGAHDRGIDELIRFRR